ncbi:hypothetical protein OPQ81_010290 [Rhizoctonia solani]|nr:hypothetical protein OPQ81_010290 [Rhizoctonia solani]
MDVDLGENDRMEFKGVIDVEFGLSPSDALPNGTFYYDELPEPMVPTPVYASYFRDMDGTDRIRVEFKVGPGETTQLGCFESDEAIPSLAFISDSHGPGAFIRAPKE